MSHKTYIFKLQDMAKTHKGSAWLTTFTLRDWDDNKTTTFTIETDHEPIDCGNLSIKVNIPDEPVSI